MSHVSPRSWAFAQHDLSIPRWAFVAWLIHRRQLQAPPRPTLALAPQTDIESRRRERLLRELVPQDV